MGGLGGVGGGGEFYSTSLSMCTCTCVYNHVSTTPLHNGGGHLKAVLWLILYLVVTFRG